MVIKAIFFDMGGTLERVWSAPDQRLQLMPEMNLYLKSLGINLGLSEDELFGIVDSRYRKYHQWSVETMNELSPTRVWQKYLLIGFPESEMITDSIAENLMYFLEDRFYRREFRPEVPEVLEAISKKGLKIGLISNICCHGLVPANLKKYGISAYFDPVVLSSEFGRRKPDPTIFIYAAQLARLQPADCIYVGDRIARDVLGAKQAGFSGAFQIINDYAHGEEDNGAEPDDIFYQMTELLDFI